MSLPDEELAAITHAQIEAKRQLNDAAIARKVESIRMNLALMDCNRSYALNTLCLLAGDLIRLCGKDEGF